MTEIYDHVKAVLKLVASEQPILNIRYKREGDSITLRTTHTSATINWDQDAINMLERARLTIWTFKAIPFSFGKREETGKAAFWPDYTVKDGLCWRDDAGRISTPEGRPTALFRCLENVRAYERTESND